jgi:hypothetical protein
LLVPEQARSPQEQLLVDAQQLPLQVVWRVEVSDRLQSAPSDVGVHENVWHVQSVLVAFGHPKSAQHRPIMGVRSVYRLHGTPFGDPTLQRHESPTLLQSVLPGEAASPHPPSALPPKHAWHESVMHDPRSSCVAASVPHAWESPPLAQLVSEDMQLDAPQHAATCLPHALAMHFPQAVSSPVKWQAADR